MTRVRNGLLSDSTLTPTTIYFSHYLFETYRVLGATDALFERLRFWTDLRAHGFVTTPEKHEPTRSDCHAWGAHPLFHAFATMLGIRPSAPGFATVDIAPTLGPLQRMSGSMVHPMGRIDVDLSVAGTVLTGKIVLPAGVSGVLRFGDDVRQLAGGPQTVTMGERSRLG